MSKRYRVTYSDIVHADGPIKAVSIFVDAVLDDPNPSEVLGTHATFVELEAEDE